MSLIEQFPQIGASSGGGGGGSWNGGTVTGATTFNTSLAIDESLAFGVQPFALNGGAQNISASGGTIVKVTGSTTGSTLNLPAASANSGEWLQVLNQATAVWTLGSAGGNVDGAGSQTIKASAAATVYVSDGSNWYSVSPGQSFNDARYGQSGNANTWSAQNTFDAEVDLDGAVTLSASSVALNGGTQTLATTSALVRVTGSTASSTVALPAAPISNQLILIDSQASASYTLSGNGLNIDGAASKTVASTGPIALWYTGSAWESLTWPQYLLDARFGGLSANNTWSGTQTFNSTVAFSNGQSIAINGEVRFADQAASASTLTVSSTAGCYIESTYSPTGAQTITLPSAPVSEQVLWIVDEGLDAGTNNVTVSGNGKNINGSGSIALAKNGAAVGLRYSGSAWFVFSAYNYP